MKRSTDRILTTHTGSLPRPEKLVDLMFAKEEKRPVDAAKLAASVRDSVREVVKRQHEVGIAVVSDGEMSKPSYATYVTERLTGFAGKSDRPKLSDILEHPNVASHYFNDPGVRRLNENRPACNGPVAPKGLEDAQADIDNFKQSTQGRAGVRCLHDRGLARRRLDVPRQHVLQDRRGIPMGRGGGHEAGVRGDHRGRLPAAARLPRPGHDASSRIRRPAARGIHGLRAAAHRSAERRDREHPRRIACACTCAGATTRARTIATCRSSRSSS